jgi:hypothetical protein
VSVGWNQAHGLVPGSSRLPIANGFSPYCASPIRAATSTATSVLKRSAVAIRGRTAVLSDPGRTIINMTAVQPLVTLMPAAAPVSGLPYSQLELHFRLPVDARGLGFLGPTIRGAFGHRFKATVCHVAHGQCGRCFIRDSCPFPLVFDGYVPAREVLRKYPAAPPPFVLDVAPPGHWAGAPEDVRFGIRLFGPATAHAGYVLEACRSFEESGLGPRRLVPVLEKVACGLSGQVLWRAGDTTLAPPVQSMLTPLPSPRDGVVRWHFETPLALRVDGRPAAVPSGLDLVLAGRRRHALLHALYGIGDIGTVDPPARLEASAFRTMRNALRRWTADRWSGRQHRKVELAGMLGTLDIEGPWSQAGPWAGVAHVTGLGKQTVFGFGRVRWEQLA